MDKEVILSILFHWILPLAVAIGAFLITIKGSRRLYERLDMDRIWRLFVKIGIGVGVVVAICVWVSRTELFSQVMVWANQGIDLAKQQGFIQKAIASILILIKTIIKFITFWTPVYVRAFVVVWVISTFIEIKSLLWRISFTRGANIILSTVALFPLLIFKYFVGYQTPVFDYMQARLNVALLKENLNDSYFDALQGVDEKGNKFDEGAGGTVRNQTIKATAVAVKRTHAQVKTSGGKRHAELIVIRSHETETDKNIENMLKGFGKRLVAPSIRFQDDPVFNAEKRGFVFDSEVDYNAGDELGSWRSIFINPFTVENRASNGGEGAIRVFEGVIIGLFSYVAHLTPYAIYERIMKNAKTLFSHDDSAEKAKYTAEQNLDLNVVPTPKDVVTGNDIVTQKKNALRVAQARVNDVTNALNAYKLTGTFKQVIVGGNTAVYEYTLPREANLPTDFDKIQAGVSNMLKISDIPIIRVSAGVLSLTMVNGVNIPVDFRDMILNRKKGMPSLISGIAGVDALGKNIYFELGDKNPHAMLFGKTGTGKTVTIMTIIYSIMSAVSPDDLKIAYCDGKGNSFEFMRTDNKDDVGFHPNPYTYAQPADASGDIDYARALINHMVLETRRRIDLFKKDKVSKLADYNKLHPDKKLFEILFVCDEFSAITQQDKNLKASEVASKGTVDKFEYLAKMSRSVGIRMLLANQSARKELVPGKISANVTGRLSLGVAEPIESDIALPESGIAVHLISQAGEFYSIMNGIRNPEHGNSPYLPDDVMYSLNDGLEKKFGHKDYVLDRKAIMDEMENGSIAEVTKSYDVPKKMPTVDSPLDELINTINSYPEWAVANRGSEIFTKHSSLVGVSPKTRRDHQERIMSAINKAQEKAEGKEIAESANTHKTAGSKVVAVTRGNDKGVL